MGLITTAFVKQFGETLTANVQQKGSRYRNAVIVDPNIVGEEAYMEQIGPGTAREKTTRNSDVEYDADDFRRRRLSMIDIYWAKLVDKEDKLKMLIDPTSQLSISGTWAIGRMMDDKIIAAARGTAYTGKAGGTPVVLPSAQKIAVGGVGLTLDKVLEAKEKLDAAECDPEEPRFFSATAQQITNMLKTPQISSADYNSVKALVKGEINTFLGFTWIRSERLIKVTNDRFCLAWVQSGIGLGLAGEINGKIDQIPRKHYAWQIYASVSVGATRLEEEKVVEIACLEV